MPENAMRLLTMATAFACWAEAVEDQVGDVQLMQFHVGAPSRDDPARQPGTGCHTPVEGDACHAEVMWAMRVGVVENPDWYLPLTRNSSFEDFQQQMHSRYFSVCPQPCSSQDSAEWRPTPSLETKVGTGCQTSIQGDACYVEVVWAMQVGAVENPDWYLPLTRNSSFEDFQRHFHGVAKYSSMCPEPCSPRESAERRPASSPETPVGTGCHTSVEGDACYVEVMWAMQVGAVENPDWYLPLTRNSSFEDFQRHFHGVAKYSSMCPEPCSPRKSEQQRLGTPDPSSYGTPMPTALLAGTPRPTESHESDLINLSLPPYEQVGQNCQCGNAMKEFSEEHATIEICTGECSLYPNCSSVGFHAYESIWSGHCSLYDALCNDTDGHDFDTTCANPAPMGSVVVNFNRVPTPSPTRADGGTPMPTALLVGTPMPTELHYEDLLNATYPGYVQVGSNCECGNIIKEFSEEHESLEKCADECNLYPNCKSIGVHPWQSIWNGHCDLFDAVCLDTNGYDPATTCATPVPPGVLSINFNRIPSPAPTPFPTIPLDPCDPSDGSWPSSFYPCRCGPDICLTSEICSVDSCAPPNYLMVDWPCPADDIGSPYFTLSGISATESPIYSNADGNYLYWDASCDGLEYPLEYQRPRWVMDEDAPNMTVTMDLDSDGVCSYFGHHGTFEGDGVPLGESTWQIACAGQKPNMTVTITYQAETPTPEPTLFPGRPCPCEPGTCGIFTFIDLDGDGCLFEAEVNKIEGLEGHFSDMDTNGDGCLDQTECENSPWSGNLPLFPIMGPEMECTFGYYFMPGTSVCIICLNGETRRRRSEACTPCPPGMEDVGEFDNCIAGVYLVEDLVPGEIGEDIAKVNKDIDESGILLQIGDGITMSTRNPGHFERFTIAGKANFLPWYPEGFVRMAYDNESGESDELVPYFKLDHGVHKAFRKYDVIVSACTMVNGIDLSNRYPCGCGIDICEAGEVCYEDCGMVNDVFDAFNFLSLGTGGCCLGPPSFPLPTPSPTVSARGDPHLVNLQGEHFDINHGGEFTLLRIPQVASRPAEVALQASIRPEHERPCTTYITEVALSGSWLNGAVVQVRSYLKSRARNESDQHLGIRVLKHGAQSGGPWERIEDWPEGDHVISDVGSSNGFVVSMSKTLWHSKKGADESPTIAGQVVFHLQSTLSTETARIVVRQDLPGQEHLDLAVRRLSALGRADIGGLLGFDTHPESLEDITPECQRHRDGLDGQRGPRFSKPVWKTRWEKIKERRHQPGSDAANGGGQLQLPPPGAYDGGRTMDGNEAASSLAGRDLMCVCPHEDTSVGLADDETSGLAHRGDKVEGVIADFQTGRLAEATWD
jgi:hypothetical protein